MSKDDSFRGVPSVDSTNTRDQDDTHRYSYLTTFSGLQGLAGLLSGSPSRTASIDSPEDVLNETALRDLAEQARAAETEQKAQQFEIASAHAFTVSNKMVRLLCRQAELGLFAWVIAAWVVRWRQRSAEMRCARRAVERQESARLRMVRQAAFLCWAALKDRQQPDNRIASTSPPPPLWPPPALVSADRSENLRLQVTGLVSADHRLQELAALPARRRGQVHSPDDVDVLRRFLSPSAEDDSGPPALVEAPPVLVSDAPPELVEAPSESPRDTEPMPREKLQRATVHSAIMGPLP